MIRIELDRIHLELLLLAGLFATFAGVVFPPITQQGLNITPIAAFGGALAVGVYVLVHRRLFTRDAANRGRVRAIVWFALVGAVFGAAASSAVDGTPRSMGIAAVGGAAMLSAIGTQFGIVIRNRDEIAKQAVEAALDERNVLALDKHRPETSTAEPTADDTSESGEESDDTSESGEKPDAIETADASEQATANEGSDTPETASISEKAYWEAATNDESTDDNPSIPIIRTAEAGDYTEES